MGVAAAKRRGDAGYQLSEAATAAATVCRWRDDAGCWR